MTLDRLTEIIKELLAQDIGQKATGKRTFEINLNQGGIGECKLLTEGKLETVSDG